MTLAAAIFLKLEPPHAIILFTNAQSPSPSSCLECLGNFLRSSEYLPSVAAIGAVSAQPAAMMELKLSITPVQEFELTL